ncbi:anthranilate phosphoribosyltransferase [Tumebacillus sp. ITR2]|uniref:Anthranilate phosphoribosyltransferase n=1 Tax=Tumebacillus amylolyticus TaxID=2801339 RepID=A0ABS1JCG6_9BACL|nr:anthranilate phosphoribosyltransferase [Tumebacillus amylolyticus]MBL0387970.1 anthranilate phosphoribosyltransferase [Tumebacillus amylolyticus]
MKQALLAVINGETLTAHEAESAMEQIMSGEATHAQIAGFLTALRMRGETVEEITGFARAMRRFSTKVESKLGGLVDTCGTGGDGAETFNISTTASFVAAAAGVPIAKHGNRAVSSKSGSADVLQALGVEISLTQEQAAHCLEQVGIAFLFAQNYHPAMKHAIAPRKELGFRTVFNVLGPLTNPAGAKRQVIGCFHPDLVEKMAHVLADLGAEHALVVHGLDGLDEITVTGSTKIAEVRDGRVIDVFTLTPEEVGLSRHAIEELRGGDAVTNAAIARHVLQGHYGAARDVVAFNAGATIYVAGLASSIREGVELAKQALDSGRALAVLQQLAITTQQVTQERELA